MKYEETLRRHVLRPLVQLGLSQDTIAAKLGIDPSRLSKLLNDRPEAKPLTVDEIEGLHMFLREGAAIFTRAAQLTALPVPDTAPPAPPLSPPATDSPPAEERRRPKVK